MTIIKGDATTGIRTGLAGRVANALSALATPAGPGNYSSGSIGASQLNALIGAIVDAFNLDFISTNQIGPAGTLAYSASIPVVAGAYTLNLIVPSNGTAFTIQAPSSPTSGCQLTICIRNTFGTLGAATFTTGAGGYRLGSAWAQPANGFSRSITFIYDGSVWVEINRSAADVSN